MRPEGQEETMGAEEKGEIKGNPLDEKFGCCQKTIEKRQTADSWTNLTVRLKPDCIWPAPRSRPLLLKNDQTGSFGGLKMARETEAS